MDGIRNYNQSDLRTMHSSYLLISPNSEVSWCSQSTGPSFFRIKSKSRIEAFITGRDSDGISRIGLADIHILDDGSLKLVKIAKDPVFDIGESGCFDENGVSYPWLLSHEDKEYMFYVGWVAGGKNRFQNFLGLAVRDGEDELFRRVSKAPIIDRSSEEPYGIGSCCVMRGKKKWLMLYTSFLPWRQDNNKSPEHPHSQPSYNIKYAVSEDLIHWERSNKSVLEFENGEHIHGKPVLTQKENGDLNLYFSVRGEAYRVGYAEGCSIHNLERKANLVFEGEKWMSKTQEYAFPLRNGQRTYLFFNGNGYGRSGLGYAIL
jgi:hypothetical protein